MTKRKVWGVAILGIVAVAASAVGAGERIEIQVEKRVLANDGAAPTVNQQIQVGIGDARPVTIDVSGLAIGESRSETTDTGRLVTLTRQEAGYQLSVDGKQIEIIGDGGDGARVFVHKSGEPGAYSWHSAQGHGDGSHVFVHRTGSSPDEVVILGLGDLDESARRRVIDALRSAGVSKEVRIIPSGDAGAGESVQVFVTSEDGGKEKTRVIRRVEKKSAR